MLHPFFRKMLASVIYFARLLFLYTMGRVE